MQPERPAYLSMNLHARSLSSSLDNLLVPIHGSQDCPSTSHMTISKAVYGGDQLPTHTCEGSARQAHLPSELPDPSGKVLGCLLGATL